MTRENIKTISDENISQTTKKLAFAALFAALSYIGFQVFRFDIPVGTDKTAFHLGNTFVALGALFLGGPAGGMAGAAGLTIADLTSGYAASAPKTFVLKLIIGLIVGLVAHKFFKLSQVNEKKKIVLYSFIGSFCGLAFNVVADPLIGYLYKQYVLGLPQEVSEAFAKIAALTTSVNAATSIIFAAVLYSLLKPVLVKAGLFVRLEK